MVSSTSPTYVLLFPFNSYTDTPVWDRELSSFCSDLSASSVSQNLAEVITDFPAIFCLLLSGRALTSYSHEITALPYQNLLLSFISLYNFSFFRRQKITFILLQSPSTQLYTYQHTIFVKTLMTNSSSTINGRSVQATRSSETVSYFHRIFHLAATLHRCYFGRTIRACSPFKSHSARVILQLGLCPVSMTLWAAPGRIFSAVSNSGNVSLDARLTTTAAI